MAPKAKVQRQNTLQISEWSEVELDKRVQTVIAGKTYLGTVRFSGRLGLNRHRFCHQQKIQ